MKLLFALLLLGIPSFSQPEPSTSSVFKERFSRLLTFEVEQSVDTLGGWLGGPPGTLAIDRKVVHSGKSSGRIRRTPDSPQSLSRLFYSTPLTYKGSRVELHGWLRTDKVKGFAGLWVRQLGGKMGPPQEDTRSQSLQGKTDWKEYSVSLPIQANDRDLRVLYFGVILSGTGTVWVDDLQLLVDGKPLWEQSRQTASEPSTEALALSDLTPVQSDNLALLGRVWAFLKYHHPRVVGGELDWDQELLRQLPVASQIEKIARPHEP